MGWPSPKKRDFWPWHIWILAPLSCDFALPNFQPPVGLTNSSRRLVLASACWHVFQGSMKLPRLMGIKQCKCNGNFGWFSLKIACVSSHDPCFSHLRHGWFHPSIQNSSFRMEVAGSIHLRCIELVVNSGIFPYQPQMMRGEFGNLY